MARYPSSHPGPLQFWQGTAGALCLAALLSACSGGGGGGSSTPQGPVVTGNGLVPNTGPGDTQRYFPTATGNRWTFDTTSTAGGTVVDSLNTTSITGTRTVLGETAQVLAQVDSGSGQQLEQYINVRPGGLSLLGNSDTTDFITPQIVPYVELAFPVALGTVSTVTASRLPAGKDPAGNALTADLTQRVVNAAFETVAVPAGTFTNALRQVTQIDGSVRDAALDLSVAFSGTDTRWLVPGVGIVKQTTVATVDGDTSSSSGVLRGYRIDGVPRGLGDAFVAVPNLSPVDNFAGKPDGDPAIATDGSRYLVVARRSSGSAPPYQAQWLATLLAADGSVLASTALDAPDTADNADGTRRAAVAFDGSQYLVVTARDNHFAQSGLAPSLVAVRVSATGALVGTPQVVAAPGAAAPALAFDGGRFLLAYTRPLGNGDIGGIWARFIAPATGLADGAEFATTGGAGNASSPALACGGGRCLVVWNQYASGTLATGVMATRVDAGGNLLDTAGIAVRSTSGCCFDQLPAVRHDGTQWLVAWRDFARQRDNLHTNIVLARVSAAGQLLDSAVDPPGIAVTTALNLMEGGPKLVPAPGGETLLVWAVIPPTQAVWDLRGARYAAGALSTTDAAGTPLLRRGWIMAPAAAGHGGGALLVWLTPATSTEASRIGAMAVYPFGP